MWDKVKMAFRNVARNVRRFADSYKNKYVTEGELASQSMNRALKQISTSLDKERPMPKYLELPRNLESFTLNELRINILAKRKHWKRVENRQRLYEKRKRLGRRL